MNTLSTIAQTRRDTINSKVNAIHDELAAFAGPVALQKLDLNVIEGINVGKSVADGACQERVFFKQSLLVADRKQDVNRVLPLLT
jgi:hypothetical protein